MTDQTNLSSIAILIMFIEMRYRQGYNDAEIVDELLQKFEALKKRLN
jgi:hypothetical protein